MSDFLYACIQLVHNIGAAAVVGSPAAACWLVRAKPVVAGAAGARESSVPVQRKLAWFTMLAWSAQIASGAGFGATTYYLKHALPELTGVGLAALGIKMSCAALCCLLVPLVLRGAPRWSLRRQLGAWRALFLLGLTALVAAAFLRWYG